eukprot:GHVS01105574.1.p1 GENE.GHVS01105574.1~~GHVS01105574.1.p1  ORF type:complete len:894 (-),score=185.23 GHVS01105574.1:327-3008(-)
MENAQYKAVSGPVLSVHVDEDEVSEPASEQQSLSINWPYDTTTNKSDHLEISPAALDCAEKRSPSRERWSGRLSFWLAAIGGAVGIGNLWRFPSLCFEYGGGAFFIPYVVALFFIGIPLLTLELAIGQCFQGGHLVAFNRLSRRFRGVGVAGVFVGFMVTCYYTVILSWGLRYCVDSFRGSPLPWALSVADQDMCGTYSSRLACQLAELGGTDGVTCRWKYVEDGDGACVADMNKKAQHYFDKRVLDKADDSSAYPTSINPFVVLGLVVVWLFVFVALFKGVLSTGIVVYITMSVPIIMLLILAIRGVMLDGAIVGLTQYMGQWDLSVLWERPEVWSKAVGQIYFSIGVGYGVMTAYASYNKVNQNVAVDSLVIAISNSCVSLLAGVAVFAVAGYLATTSGLVDASGAVDVSQLRTGGPDLVFVIYPLALATIPNSNWLCVLFFLTFFLLGIDSAFALAEALVTMLCDSRMLSWDQHTANNNDNANNDNANNDSNNNDSNNKDSNKSSVVATGRKLVKQVVVGPRGVRRWVVAACVCVVGVAVGLPYCTNAGIYLLDSADNYLAIIASLFIGACEATAAGWVYGSGRQAARIGYKPVVMFGLSYFVPTVVAICVGFSKSSLGWVAAPCGFAAVAALSLLSLLLVPTHDALTGQPLLWQTRAYLLFLYNIELLREELNSLFCSHPSLLPSSTYTPPTTSPSSSPTYDHRESSEGQLSFALHEVPAVLGGGAEGTAKRQSSSRVMGRCCWCTYSCAAAIGAVVRMFTCQLTVLFSLTIKFVIPAAMMVLLGQTFSRQSIESGDLLDENKYALYVHIAGLALAAVAVLMIILGWMAPEVYSPLLSLPVTATEEELTTCAEDRRHTKQSATSYLHKRAKATCHILPPPPPHNRPSPI